MAFPNPAIQHPDLGRRMMHPNSHTMESLPTQDPFLFCGRHKISWSSPPLDTPKYGQLAFPPNCWPHFQTQPCTTCTYVVKRKQSGFVRKCEVGAQHVRHLPFWHHFAPFWQENLRYISKLAPILPLSRTLAALAQLLDAAKSDLGEGVEKVYSVGYPVATGCGCQHRRCDTPQHLHAFKPDQA